MNETIKARLAALRKAMEQKGISACYIPTSDFHGSEYIGSYFQTRRFFSGFTGSAGTLVVTAVEAGLWTDGRYFLQAEQQLAGTGIDLYRMGEAGVPAAEDWLKEYLTSGEIVALDGRVTQQAEYARLAQKLEASGVLLKTDWDPAEGIWKDRPSLAASEVWPLALQYTGKSAAEKLAELRAELKTAGANVHVITTLDDIAWLFNLRGSDIPYNPVFLSYAAIEEECAWLFTDASRLTAEALEALKEAGVAVLPYEDVYTFVQKYSKEDRVLVSAGQMNHLLYSLLQQNAQLAEVSYNPCTLQKNKKNETEQKNFREAHRKDGLAVAQFLHQVKQAAVTSELEAGALIDNLRLQQEGCIGPSFDTIAGYGPHGAIVHYGATEESNSPLEPKGFLLVDSGGQYPEGTTDITRTVALGPLTDEQKTDFTLVLRGMIDVAMAKFPKGTCGYHLDPLARMPLWSAGLDYNHGTGHGIGAMLCVHEGPIGIRKRAGSPAEQIPLEPGMILSDEPGVYKAGSHGIRIENLVLCKESEIDGFLELEALTLAPIDREAILPALLTAAERRWLNDYHKRVYETLAPGLTPEVAVWLKEACAPL